MLTTQLVCNPSHRNQTYSYLPHKVKPESLYDYALSDRLNAKAICTDCGSFMQVKVMERLGRGLSLAKNTGGLL